MCSAFVVCVACATAGSRTLFAMGREGVLPAAFGHPFSNYYFWATTGTLVIIVVYIMLCIGSIVFFYRTRATRNWNPLVHVVVPLIGAIVFGAALYGSVHPTPPGILARKAAPTPPYSTRDRPARPHVLMLRG